MTTTSAQYTCRQPRRVAEVRDQKALNGIEWLEVASDDQRTLAVHFVHPLPGGGAAGAVPPGGAALGAANLRIEGGVRERGITVLGVAAAGDVLTVTTSRAGDFSTYTLRIVTSDVDDTVPRGFDPRLAAIEFSFKAGCPSEFDCAPRDGCPPEELVEPALPYLAKDYATFRRLMLDRLSVLMPAWRPRSPADPMLTLVESLALTADHLSYWQDAVATEAYLGTARRRVSLRRHARLLDYRMHDGCNARTWVHFVARRGGGITAVPRGTEVLTSGAEGDEALDTARVEEVRREKPTAFATMHDVDVREEHNRIALYTWSDEDCCLPAGATSATLRNEPPLALAPGDWLLFEEVVSPTTGLPIDADGEHRQVVRLTRAEPAVDPLSGTAVMEVGWDAEDALRFPLCVSVVADGVDALEVSVARGNVALADHGLAVRESPVRCTSAAPDRPPGARLRLSGLTFATPFDAATFLTARAAREVSPDEALPTVVLRTEGLVWQPRRDLLMSDRFSPDFVVEMESDGEATLRFGDGVHGLRPADETTFEARYRVGNGTAGNVGADTLTWLAREFAGIEGVRNPLPAVGGADPESMEEVRQFAPQAFRWQERAVTTGDWVDVSQRQPTVQRAAAQFRWTGSWHTVFVAVDREGGLPVDEDARFRASFRAALDRYRLAGYDLEVRAPIFVPLDVALEVCARPGYFRSDVKRDLIERFDARVRRDGRRGFFHPDHFTFGQPVYLSRVYEAAMQVAGVASVRVVRFKRYGKPAATELADGFAPMSSREVARLDNDPSLPENGRLEISVEGGQ